MNILNQTESAVFKLWMLYFRKISFQIIKRSQQLSLYRVAALKRLPVHCYIVIIFFYLFIFHLFIIFTFSGPLGLWDTTLLVAVFKRWMTYFRRISFQSIYIHEQTHLIRVRYNHSLFSKLSLLKTLYYVRDKTWRDGGQMQVIELICRIPNVLPFCPNVWPKHSEFVWGLHIIQ